MPSADSFNTVVREEPALTLERLLTVVGAGALELFAAPLGLEVPVHGVVVLDAQEPGPVTGQLLLAVGVEPRSADAVELVRSSGRAGAVAVVFRQDGTGQPSAALRAAAADAGTAILFRTAWVDWARLVGALRAGLVAAGVPTDPDLATVALGDLDRLAEAVAALVGGSVTIEDPQSRVLAYSSTDEAVDEFRQRTILGRQVPRPRVADMQRNGLLPALWGSGDVIHRPAAGNVPERLAIAISAGGEILGSLWVAAAGQPLPPTARQALRTAARAAAPHLLHHRFRRAGQAHLVLDAARALLEGRGSAEALSARTALPVEGHCAVLAVCGPTAQPDAGADSGSGTGSGAACGPGSRQGTDGGAADLATRLTDQLVLHCAAQERQAVVVPSGRGALVLVGGLAKDPEQAASQVTRLGEALARQVSAVLGTALRVGLGEARPRLDQAPDSRETAELALRALLFRADQPPVLTVARATDLAEAVALLWALDALREVELPPGTPVARLAAYDAGHGGGALVATLRAHLDHFGDTAATAQALGIHVSTLRYRIKRLREVCGIDVDDPDSRLLAHMQLRLLDQDRPQH
ncbi:PucR family transcriptional regulator [Streptomyces zagrosensis]|uniref:PucR family transcriptional regulator n=1 Tax=Streptomyces zagrosensis TaxID=1042984 RepID=A0A7W9QFP5_9ACTN|nr:PucR family transcriptional regulator [Streptomyces zagrosensis]MBB5939416.1 hypothetical protein [Streptomyces zagrosensis]